MYNNTMISMIQKIRALTEDFIQSSVEVFTYETSGVFTLAEPRIVEVTKTLINGEEIQSTQSAEFDSSNNKLTVFNEDFVSGDIVEVTYSFAKSSDSEVVEYIRAALVWLNIYGNESVSYNLSSSGIIIPNPDIKALDLICIIASIIIKPDYISYKTGNMSVTYPTSSLNLSKEAKIFDLISNFQTGIGVIGIIKYDRCL